MIFIVMRKILLKTKIYQTIDEMMESNKSYTELQIKKYCCKKYRMDLRTAGTFFKSYLYESGKMNSDRYNFSEFVNIVKIITSKHNPIDYPTLKMHVSLCNKTLGDEEIYNRIKCLCFQHQNFVLVQNNKKKFLWNKDYPFKNEFYNITLNT